MRERIDLDDRAVNVKIQLAARLAHVLDLTLYVRGIGIHRIPRADREAELLQIVERRGVARDWQFVRVLDIEAKDGQLALFGNFAVLLPQRARRRIARVGEQRLFVQFQLCVERVEHGFLHIHLAAHDQVRRRVFQLVRDILYGLEVRGHVLADLPVAARCAADKFAVHILKRDRKAVDLVFDHIFRLSHRALNAGVELGKLVKRKNILQAFERISMRHLGEPAGRRTPDPLGRRIRIRVFRVRRLECAQLALHHVVLVVRNLRRVLVIVFIVVIPQLFTQCGDLFACVHANIPSKSQYSI